VPRRILFVHAHPDDETINNGATMARYAAAGAGVTLVTCTRGEQGEVIPAELSHLEGAGRSLADYRAGELAAAVAALGVTDHRFLGDDDGTVYLDSGMAYDRDGGVVPSPDPPPGAFAPADVETAAGHLATVIREVRPQVVVGYEPGGGYGHPDHVQAHLVTMRAVELAGAGTVAKVYWTAVPEELATAVVDGTAFVEAKRAAMRAHETQLTVTPDGTSFGLSNGVHEPITGLELYRLVRGEAGGELDDAGRETDLFGGLDP
jgi:N-acetyl-1-D-myo-inositol-2-amino-2-deoxy-alpha-D-glucopyranoside deacetylase